MALDLRLRGDDAVFKGWMLLLAPIVMPVKTGIPFGFLTVHFDDNGKQAVGFRTFSWLTFQERERWACIARLDSLESSPRHDEALDMPGCQTVSNDQTKGK